MPETHSNNSEVEGEVRGDQTAVEELVNKLDVLNVTSEKGMCQIFNYLLALTF